MRSLVLGVALLASGLALAAPSGRGADKKPVPAPASAPAAVDDDLPLSDGLDVPAPPPPAAPEPAPVAAVPAEAPLAEVPTPDAPPDVVSLELGLGGGVTSEDEADDRAPFGRVSLGFNWSRGGLEVRVPVAFALYDTTEFLPLSGGTGALTTRTFSERRIDAGASIGYRVALASGALELVPAFALRSTSFVGGEGAARVLASASPELQLRMHLAGSVSVEVGGAYDYNLLRLAAKEPSSAVLGAPVALTRYFAGVRWKYDTGSVSLAYVGEVLTLERSYRFFDGLSVSLARHF